MSRKRRPKIDPTPIMPVGGFAVVHHYARDVHGFGPVVIGQRPDDVDAQGRGLYTRTTWRPYLAQPITRDSH